MIRFFATALLAGAALHAGIPSTDVSFPVPTLGNQLFFFFGISTGIVFMTAIYNAVLYAYNRKIMFFYYTMMQLTVIFTLVYISGVLPYADFLPGNLEKAYAFTTHLGLIAATLFTRSFLETKRYLPKSDKFLLVFLAINILSIFLVVMELTFLADMVPCFGMISIFLFIGYFRLRQGFKPALFYLIGWSMMILAIAWTIYNDIMAEDALLSGIFLSKPLIIGSPLEAIFLAMALFYMVKESEQEKKKQSAILIQQSKLASMGELLCNISHQWRQPLTNLSYILMNIKSASKDPAYIVKKVDEGERQIEYMSETVESFRNFYRPDTEKETFDLHAQTRFAAGLVQGELQRHGISLSIELAENTTLSSYKNQFVQVVLNLLGNAKDALVTARPDTPFIRIRLTKKRFRIEDNGGGVPPLLLQKVFEPYFTTKSESSGIGLYMSKVIIEKNMDGIMTVENTSEGFAVTLTF